MTLATATKALVTPPADPTVLNLMVTGAATAVTQLMLMTGSGIGIGRMGKELGEAAAPITPILEPYTAAVLYA